MDVKYIVNECRMEFQELDFNFQSHPDTFFFCSPLLRLVQAEMKKKKEEILNEKWNKDRIRSTKRYRIRV